MSFKASLQNFTLNSVFRKLWFCVFAATYVWIKSEVLNTGLWNCYHLFFLILSIFLCMKSTLAKKIPIILDIDCFSFLKTINENYLKCIPQNSVHCFNCSFVSDVKWWTHVSSMVMNRCKKSALLLWDIAKNSIETSSRRCFCSIMTNAAPILSSAFSCSNFQLICNVQDFLKFLPCLLAYTVLVDSHPILLIAVKQILNNVASSNS